MQRFQSKIWSARATSFFVNELRHATSFTYMLSFQFAREFDSPTIAVSWETRGQNFDYKGKPLINVLAN